MNSTEFTFLKAFTSEFKFRTNPVKAFSGMCVRLTSITFNTGISGKMRLVTLVLSYYIFGGIGIGEGGELWKCSS